MSRKGTFSSGNTCEAFISASMCVEHIIASLGLSLSSLCISCHHLHLHEADAQQREQHSPGDPRFQETTLGGQSRQSKDVGLPSCLACSYGSTVLHEESIIVRGLEISPKIRMVILPQAKGPPTSSSGQKRVFPLNVLPALNYLQLLGVSECFGLMDLFPQCTVNLYLNPRNLFVSPVFFRKEYHRSTTHHAKTTSFCLFVLNLLYTNIVGEMP